MGAISSYGRWLLVLTAAVLVIALSGAGTHRMVTYNLEPRVAVAAGSQPVAVATERPVRIVAAEVEPSLPDKTEVALAPAPAAAPALAEVAKSGEQRWRVTVSALNVRAEPSSNSPVVGRVFEGDALSVAEASGNWLRIRLPTGDTGWVFRRHVAPL